MIKSGTHIEMSAWFIKIKR